MEVDLLAQRLYQLASEQLGSIYDVCAKLRCMSFGVKARVT